MQFKLKGYHNYDNLDNFKSNENPDQTSNNRFFIFVVKTISTKCYFSVTKTCLSDFPYL